jgi:large subunit ribosomal protein L25
MEAAATMHLSELTPPEGVVFLDDPEETIVATVTIPTEVVEPEIEEETELVGDEAEAVVGDDAGDAGAAPAEGEGGGGEES